MLAAHIGPSSSRRVITRRLVARHETYLETEVRALAGVFIEIAQRTLLKPATQAIGRNTVWPRETAITFILTSTNTKALAGALFALRNYG